MAWWVHLRRLSDSGAESESASTFSEAPQTKDPPRDPKTGRRVIYSLGLLEDDIQALEEFLVKRRAACSLEIL